MNSKLILILIVAIASFACKREVKTDSFSPSADFFGQELPANQLGIFAPGVVSTGLNEGTITFSPDGKECYWSILFSGFETIVFSKLENGIWTKPEVASFSGKYYDGWPAMQPDGKRMFFHSTRPNPDSTNGITAKYNIWYMDRNTNGWSEPKIVNVPVNSSENSTCPSVTKNGILYISKRFSDDTEKLCRSEYINGSYQTLEVLPEIVNVLQYNFHGCVAPDENYLIRPAYGRPDNIGSGWNYYITFRDSIGKWSDLKNLGKEINSLYCAGAPSISYDGKLLFFQARVAAKETFELDGRFNLNEMIEKEIKNHSNGSADIYWIDSKIVDEIKTNAIK
ncbi:MAG: hypothetical protein AB9846_14435 [Tenuifilaceae bacterium]